MPGGRVAVIGGSIGGCASALALVRGVADEVVVFERATGRLEDRGVGLGVHAQRYAELAAAGYLADHIPWHGLTRRTWRVRDADHRLGRVVWEQPFAFRSYTWGLLWQELRRGVPAAVDYRVGDAVVAVHADPDGVEVELRGGTRQRFDAVIGADGYRSTVRQAMLPGVQPVFAGYVMFRGVLAETRLPDTRLPDTRLPDTQLPETQLPAALLPEQVGWDQDDVVTVSMPGAQLITYRIPGLDGPAVNWAVYATTPREVQLADPTSLPPGRVTERLLSHLRELARRELPGFWAEVIDRTPAEVLQVQPVYDMTVPRYASGRLALVGDAATVVRPHLGSGAVKALQDAAALEAACAAGSTWTQTLDRYDRARHPVGQAQYALARRLGRAQVEQSADWARMTAADAVAWWEEQNAGTAGFGGHALVTAPGSAEAPSSGAATADAGGAAVVAGG